MRGKIKADAGRRGRGRLSRSAIAAAAVTLMEDQTPNAPFLVDLVRELLIVKLPNAEETKRYQARETAVQILAQAPRAGTRSLAGAVGVNPATVSRWRKEPSFLEAVEKHREYLARPWTQKLIQEADDARLVADAADKKLNLAGAKFGDEHFYASLPLCIIDAVFSIGVKYKGTRSTVIRWAKHQEPEWPLYRCEGGREHTVDDFITSLGSMTPDQLADASFGNRQRTSSTNGILKADAVRSFALALREAGINSFEDMKNEDKVKEAEKRVKEVKGQGSGISFDYFTLLAGNDEIVKADRMLCRFVADALGIEAKKLPPSRAKEAVIKAAALLNPKYQNINSRLLDFVIWSFESERAATRKRRGEKRRDCSGRAVPASNSTGIAHARKGGSNRAR